MFDTVIAVVGNALTMPEWRRLERTNALVANFKIASTSRRYDRENNRWIDGDSLRLRVTCWRRLAEGVVASIKVGDPLVVSGRLYTREWTTTEGERRTMYELEAVAIGHDLARGIAAFKRVRPNLSTSVVEDAEADIRIAGEPTEAMPELNERSATVVSALFGDDDYFGRSGPAEEVAEPIDSGGPGFDAPGAADVEDPFADFGPGSLTRAAPPTGTAPAGERETAGEEDEEAAHGGGASGADPTAYGSEGPGGESRDGGGQGAARGRRGRGRVPANA